MVSLLKRDKVEGNFKLRSSDQRSGKLEVQYLYDYAATSTEIGLNANPIVNFSVVVGTDVLSLGTDVSFDTNLGTFSKCNAGLSFTYNNGLVTSFNLNNKGDTLSTSYYYALSRVNDTVVGMEMTHSCSTNEDTFTIGIKHQLNELSTVKASLNSFGKVTTLFQLEWSPNSLFALSTPKLLIKGENMDWLLILSYRTMGLEI
ncbi:Mitochondrial outer membrane protein porin of 36 kDa [Capsicum baccatum]|uniref:Mitochondrial outer membrane protein porin of 36 kDa n=1 Tax=Capsicum baccatum TaxID=33114 RepID=A0A2G2XI91_CAPBA|nr:Mitochondrial outer membrane protein porin of 36 kDa [Capsicum baccatum]